MSFIPVRSPKTLERVVTKDMLETARQSVIIIQLCYQAYRFLFLDCSLKNYCLVPQGAYMKNQWSVWVPLGSQADQRTSEAWWDENT